MIEINHEEYLTKAEAALSLGRSVRMVERLMLAGDLPKFEYLGGQVLTKREDVERLKTANLKPATGGRPVQLREVGILSA